jgi:hypothetical protein
MRPIARRLVGPLHLIYCSTFHDRYQCTWSREQKQSEGPMALAKERALTWMYAHLDASLDSKLTYCQACVSE